MFWTYTYSLALLSIFMGIFLWCGGCSSTSAVTKNDSSHPTTTQETNSALQAVAGSLKGEPVSKEELRHLSQQMRKDKETQTAVQSVTEAITGKNVSVKYCPVDGKRYSAQLQYCPEHRVLLKNIEE